VQANPSVIAKQRSLSLEIVTNGERAACVQVRHKVDTVHVHRSRWTCAAAASCGSYGSKSRSMKRLRWALSFVEHSISHSVVPRRSSKAAPSSPSSYHSSVRMNRYFFPLLPMILGIAKLSRRPSHESVIATSQHCLLKFRSWSGTQRNRMLLPIR
jgi:hypothetical protein